jgi:SET domain
MFVPQKDIQGNFPVCPSELKPLGCVLTDGQSLQVWRDESLVGHWVPLSSHAIEIVTEDSRIILNNVVDDVWKDYSSNTKYEWTSVSKTRKRKRSGDAGYLLTPGSASKRLGSRACMLPLHPLDIKHRQLVEALGLRICMHSDVGRVLVTSRTFESGDIVTFSNLTPYKISTEEELTALVKPTDPPGSYLCVPRSGVVYYNPEFCADDPISSGDIWYLVNHSENPNCELKAHSHGLMIRARRRIKENEPLTWAYNSGFFGSADSKVDLPSIVVPDESTVFQN